MSTKTNLTDQLNFLRNQYDALWLTFHNYECNQFKRSLKRNPKQIRADVFKEPSIQELIEKDPEIKKKIDKILDEMSHTFTLRSIRFIGYFVVKIMKSIYRHAWIDDNISIDPMSFYFDPNNTTIPATINRLVTESPVVYLPTHRSYADFLLLSYICFQMNLPLPAIAAGIDFLSLKQIASLLRSCGAFFIRRSFKGSEDKLYRSIFRTYVQDIVKGGEMPLECFIEGTRSRSGKSLQPKLGLIGTALKLFWTSQIPDLILVPISICYDRILEEDLYAKELSPPQIDASSGSKPKETPKHLLSGARAILAQDFGSFYIRFGSPISLREFPGNHDIRLKYQKSNKSFDGPQSSEELSFASQLCRCVIKEQHRASIISPFSLFSFIIFSDLISKCNYLEYEPIILEENTLHIDYDIEQTLGNMDLLCDLISDNNLSHKLISNSLKDEFFSCLSIHHNLVKLQQSTTIGPQSLRISFENNLTLARFRNYSNQCLQLIIEIAMVIYSSSYQVYKNLENLLSQEFVLTPKSSADYENEKNIHQNLSPQVIEILTVQINYFLINYHRLGQWLLSTGPDELLETKFFIRKAQSEVKVPMDLVQNFVQLSLKNGSLIKRGDQLITNQNVTRDLLDSIISTSYNSLDIKLMAKDSTIKPKL
ncbi:dihydroxyacetone phosphate acyltransferase-like [Panonychus citri]|uniref:dihydroxyacetone phosphate acyltransferase-like n=1 Tax=Panonychus citri TaxID=50023 RepID=UPI002308301B|nr:dihydroxyacetone phosphate acyltransferase-like [Panonychus citri]XP_053208686.1 dihydroxyacetone phosphate acyltransferase-like [Panonychus citri]XP_053208687.1 dihydroxyacetone phosphate acyltransferase-like [Panonychus citri]